MPNIVTPHQSDFTPNDSAVTQLMDLYNTFSKAIGDEKEIRVVVGDAMHLIVCGIVA